MPLPTVSVTFTHNARKNFLFFVFYIVLIYKANLDKYRQIRFTVKQKNTTGLGEPQTGSTTKVLQ